MEGVFLLEDRQAGGQWRVTLPWTFSVVVVAKKKKKKEAACLPASSLAFPFHAGALVNYFCLASSSVCLLLLVSDPAGTVSKRQTQPRSLLPLYLPPQMWLCVDRSCGSVLPHILGMQSLASPVQRISSGRWCEEA